MWVGDGLAEELSIPDLAGRPRKIVVVRYRFTSLQPFPVVKFHKVAPFIIGIAMN